MLITQSPFLAIIEVSKPLLKRKEKVIKMANKTNDMAHTKSRQISHRWSYV